MSSLRSHPIRESKIIKWVSEKKPGFEFTARDIAKSLNLTAVEVGNVLKMQGNVRIARHESMTTIWVVTE